jgi:UDP-glucose 4-epimerase|tara:strand:- start:109 stop:1017 length:909 start_codon:yes stop_codon:yes gene_type:complete
MKGSRSVVTGGAGFIGSNLVDHLVRIDHKVIVLDNFVSGKKANLAHHKKKDVKIIRVDISKSKNLDKYFKKVDYVFHLAGLAEIIPSIKNPKKYFNTNVLGTLKVVEAAKRAGVKKLIYAASSSCYGSPKNLPTSEKEKIDIKHPYGLTKFLGEKLVLKYATNFNMPNISFRFFNVYGPRLNMSGQYSAVFGNFLKQKKNNKPLTIVGDGKQTRDFIHVDDLTNAFIKVAKSRLVNKIYNLGSGKEISINKIANLFGGKKTFIPKRPREPKRSLANISKIKKDINWKPTITIQEGIKRLLKN